MLEHQPSSPREGEWRGNLEFGFFSHSGSAGHQPHELIYERKLTPAKILLWDKGTSSKAHKFHLSAWKCAFFQRHQASHSATALQKVPEASRCHVSAPPLPLPSASLSFSAWRVENGAVLFLPAVSQTLEHPTDTSLSALQLFKDSLSVYY